MNARTHMQPETSRIVHGKIAKSVKIISIDKCTVYIIMHTYIGIIIILSQTNVFISASSKSSL